jgi:hypothetical protein
VNWQIAIDFNSIFADLMLVFFVRHRAVVTSLAAKSRPGSFLATARALAPLPVGGWTVVLAGFHGKSCSLLD